MTTKRATKATVAEAYTWGSQAAQYDPSGPPGISYFAGEVGGGLPPVDCLLFRGSRGNLLGILNRYSVDYPPWEKVGNVNVWVAPNRQREGIATRLLDECAKRWGFDADQQDYTPSGAAFVNSYLVRRSNTLLDAQP